MKNLDFLEKLLKSRDDYWVVEKEDMYASGGSFKTEPSVWMVAIGFDELGERPVDIDDLTVGELKRLNSLPIKANISLTYGYPPFQMGLTLGQFVRGFSVERYVNEFLEACRTQDKPKDLWGYETIYEQVVAEKEGQV